MFALALQTEIFCTGYCWIVHLSFLTSHILLFYRFCKTSKKQHFLLFYRFCKTSKKTTFSVFLSFFFRKIVQISTFKVEYLENRLADFNDFGLTLQDFERPFRWNLLILEFQFSFKVVDSCWISSTEWSDTFRSVFVYGKNKNQEKNIS